MPAPVQTDVFWQVAVTGPVYLALAVVGVGLLLRRRAAPRACSVAGVAMLAVLGSLVGLDAVRGWLVAERDSAAPVAGLSGQALEQARLASLVLNSLVIAAAVVAVGWAVALDRRSS